MSEIKDTENVIETDQPVEADAQDTDNNELNEELNDNYSEYLENNKDKEFEYNHASEKTPDKVSDDSMQKMGIYIDENGKVKAESPYKDTREEIRDTKQADRDLVNAMEYYEDNKESYMADNPFEGMARVLKNYGRGMKD